MAHSLKPESYTPELPPEEEESHVEYYYDDPEDLPGTLDLEPDALPPEMSLIDYTENTATRIQISNPQACIPYLKSDSVSWINVIGLGNKTSWEQMAKVFQIHPLTLGDVVNVPQRPKIIHDKNQIIIITLMVRISSDLEELEKEQVSIILGEKHLITVQENPEHDCLKPVRKRIKNNQGIIRKQKVDYLAYSLLDTIIDGFFPVLEEYGERIELLEDEVVINPNHQTMQKIYQLRRELLTLRRTIWSLRDAINILIRDGSNLINPNVLVYFRDCYEHTIQLRDIVESYRDLASDLMNIYLSSVSNKMNEVMKLLTVISSIFIPLTFIAGVYGMNFNPEKSPLNMPELDWYYGYPLCLFIMFLTAVCLIYFFWQKGWFNNLSTTLKKDDRGKNT
ncbi:MAG: magnesium/cobalt transporter CorA [Okeania sp. SIO2F4]|uniref:magnesium/cobalt transporter CorA n=1 Tax=Okeania sp. SIO2F4 TaxID=2607790 RepID=UPI00142AA321|nr:magnesium/cobalt transporter CorA [Okeania sp. SIO2F4]NES01448.1 magnesium/cobalt transporter CorA [Okeania sp. SIO2F4]